MMILYDDSNMEAHHLIAPTRNRSIIPLTLSLKPRKVVGYGATSPLFGIFKSKKKKRRKKKTPLAMLATEQNRHAIANSNG